MNYTIKDLSEQELNVVINALATQPYGQVYLLIDKIRQQVVEAQSAAKSATKEE